MLRNQFGFLRRFVEQIVAGERRAVNRLRTRSELYMHSAKGMYETTRQRVHVERGHTEMQRTLGAAEKHCPDCPSLAGYWAPIGSLPLPTQGSKCRNRCACTVDYR